MELAAFRARYEEFKSSGDGLVQACLDEAEAELSSDDWGDRFDTAHGMLAAHKLWSSPFGATMRLDDGGKEVASPYMRQYHELLNKTVEKFVVT